MDVYQRVLVKLFEVTGGRDSQTVDLRDLVKGEGFLGNYNDIFQFLITNTWIIETSRTDAVKLTHWGIKEAKRLRSGAPDIAQIIERETKKLVSGAKEFLITLEVFSADASKENFRQVEKKIEQINAAIAGLKENI